MIQRHQPSPPPKANGQKVAAVNSAQSNPKAPPQNGNKPPLKMAEWFRKFAHKTSALVGSPWTFVVALLTIIGWAVLGPACKFSDTWQLVINTATTIVTFLMVFLIQNTQNRDAKAIHLKLDELIHAVKGARNKLIDLENCSDEELKTIQEQFERLGKLHRPPRPEQPSRNPADQNKS